MEHILITTPYLVHPQIVAARDCYYLDDKGNRILDLESGIWCASLGHHHPRVIEVIKAQLERLTHMGKKLLPLEVDQVGALLLEKAEMQGKVMFLNTGSEAIEFALKVARLQKPHGKLVGFTDNYVAAFGQIEQMEHRIDISKCLSCSRCCDATCAQIHQNITPDCIFIFDPFCFSRRVLEPPHALIQTLVAEIKRQNGLLILDEVTTGCGRTGKWFGYQHLPLQPDMVVLGKSLGNGYPVSAVLIGNPLVNRIENCGLSYYQSHQNDPLGIFIARSVVEVIESEELLKQVMEKSQFFLKVLKEALGGHPAVNDVRGKGLLIGIALEPSCPVEKVFAALLEQGVYIGVSSRFNMLNIFPPFTITQTMMLDTAILLADAICRNYVLNGNL